MLFNDIENINNKCRLYCLGIYLNSFLKEYKKDPFNFYISDVNIFSQTLNDYVSKMEQLNITKLEKNSKFSYFNFNEPSKITDKLIKKENKVTIKKLEKIVDEFQEKIL